MIAIPEKENKNTTMEGRQRRSRHNTRPLLLLIMMSLLSLSSILLSSVVVSVVVVAAAAASESEESTSLPEDADPLMGAEQNIAGFIEDESFLEKHNLTIQQIQDAATERQEYYDSLPADKHTKQEQIEKCKDKHESCLVWRYAVGFWFFFCFVLFCFVLFESSSF
jgi:cell division protein FtsB